MISSAGSTTGPPPGIHSMSRNSATRLRCEAWGKGYATEGSRALVSKGFTEFEVRRVVAPSMAVNTASRRRWRNLGCA